MSCASDARMTRREVAEYLSREGYPIRPTTLAKLASIGGGPPFAKFGKRVTYDSARALEWAKAKLSPEVSRYRDLANAIYENPGLFSKCRDELEEMLKARDAA